MCRKSNSDKIASISTKFKDMSAGTGINMDGGTADNDKTSMKQAIMIYVSKWFLTFKIMFYCMLLGAFTCEFTSDVRLGYYVTHGVYITFVTVLLISEIIDGALCIAKNPKMWFAVISLIARVGGLTTILAGHISIYSNPTATHYWNTNAKDFRSILVVCGFVLTWGICMTKTLYSFTAIGVVKVPETNGRPKSDKITKTELAWSIAIIVDMFLVLALFGLDIASVATIGNQFVVSVIVYGVLTGIRLGPMITQFVVACIQDGYLPILIATLFSVMGIIGFLYGYILFIQNPNGLIYWTAANEVRTVLEWASFTWNGINLFNYIDLLCFWGISMKDNKYQPIEGSTN